MRDAGVLRYINKTGSVCPPCSVVWQQDSDLRAVGEMQPRELWGGSRGEWSGVGTGGTAKGPRPGLGAGRASDSAFFSATPRSLGCHTLLVGGTRKSICRSRSREAGAPCAAGHQRLSGEHAQVFRGIKPQESPEKPNAASGSLLVSAKMTESAPVALVEFVLPGVHTVLPAPQTPPPAHPPEMPPSPAPLSGELCITF